MWFCVACSAIAWREQWLHDSSWIEIQVEAVKAVNADTDKRLKTGLSVWPKILQLRTPGGGDGHGLAVVGPTTEQARRSCALLWDPSGMHAIPGWHIFLMKKKKMQVWSQQFGEVTVLLWLMTKLT